VRIDQLRTQYFRNLQSDTVRFCAGVNILVGENGQGKTNLLEALYLTCKGTSFRHAPTGAFIEKNSTTAVLEADIAHRDLSFPVRVAVETKSKRHSVFGKKWSSSDLHKNFFCILFSPESLASIKESSEHRRELVDEFLVSYDSTCAELLAEYRKTLRTRNRILANYVDKLEDKSTTEQILASINPRFFELAVSLTWKRLQALREIEADFNQAMQLISGISASPVEIRYEFNHENRMRHSLREIQQNLDKRMQELHAAELASGTSLVGPHKHDIVILYGGQDSRFFCSQGQQRALIISFKIAQIVYHRRANGFYPILMLDDVLSELDHEKQKALIRFLESLRAQIFVTTTDVELCRSFQSGEIAVMQVKEGRCWPLAPSLIPSKDMF
jgi:DNA replication and repair protein RecF